MKAGFDRVDFSEEYDAKDTSKDPTYPTCVYRDFSVACPAVEMRKGSCEVGICAHSKNRNIQSTSLLPYNVQHGWVCFAERMTFITLSCTVVHIQANGREQTNRAAIASLFVPCSYNTFNLVV